MAAEYPKHLCKKCSVPIIPCDACRDGYHAAKAEEAVKTSHNTGSPKLPTEKECMEYVQGQSEFYTGLTEYERLAISKCREFIGRQLRAGA